MRLYYAFLLLFLMITGNIVKAQCTFSDGAQGVRDYHADYTLGTYMSGESIRYYITCAEAVTLTFNTKVEDQFYDSFQFLMNELPPPIPPRLGAIVNFDGDDGENYRYRHRKEWKFPDKAYFSVTGGNTVRLPAGRYSVSVQNYIPSYLIPSSSKPYYYPWPTMSQVLFTVGNLGQTFSVTPRSGSDVCTSDSYQINTFPGYNIDFGDLDKKELNKGRSFSQPFSIEVSRVPGDECYELVYPAIEFQTELVLDGNTKIVMDNGLHLSILDSNKKPVVFGERIPLGKLEAQGKRISADFSGVIRKNPTQSIKAGEFSTIVRYIIYMR